MRGNDRQEISISGERHSVHQVHPLKFERAVGAGKKCPKKAEAVAEIGERVRGDSSKPRPDKPRRTEDDVIPAFESVHDKLARVQRPIAVPTGTVVALGNEQGVLITILAPRDRKLVLSRKIGDAAEIEDEDLMKRVV